MVDSGAILQSRCGDLIDDNVEGENEDDHDNDEVAPYLIFVIFFTQAKFLAPIHSIIHLSIIRV